APLSGRLLLQSAKAASRLGSKSASRCVARRFSAAGRNMPSFATGPAKPSLTHGRISTVDNPLLAWSGGRGPRSHSTSWSGLLDRSGTWSPLPYPPLWEEVEAPYRPVFRQRCETSDLPASQHRLPS